MKGERPKENKRRRRKRELLCKGENCLKKLNVEMKEKVRKEKSLYRLPYERRGGTHKDVSRHGGERGLGRKTKSQKRSPRGVEGFKAFSGEKNFFS